MGFVTKKLTYDFVKEQFEEEGYTLLSKEYKNSKTKLFFTCPKGHEGSASWNSWQSGHRCAICAFTINLKALKLPYTVIKASFEVEGYTLLSTDYENNTTLLYYVCPEGHKHHITWGNWQQGYRCPYCAGLVKPTIGFIKSEFEKEGYTLLSTEYKNNYTKLHYICPNKHTHGVTWKNWRHGDRCPVCAGNAKITIDLVRESFEIEGYVLLSNNYINSASKLEYKCPAGHHHKISWEGWQLGRRCPYCAGNAKLKIDFVRASFEKEGYLLLSKDYINNSTKLNYMCPNRHKHSMIWINWKKGQRCPTCISNNIKLDIDFICKEFKSEGYVLLSQTYKNAHTKLDYLCPYGHKHSIAWTKWQQGKRCPTCAIINNSGNKHYNWKGGISCEPYCFIWKDKEFKLDILERDAYICLNPYCHGNGGVLSIHHIDYNKKNCHPSNLITVCRSCNLRANHDREWHEAWYKAIMYRRYNYDYN